MFRLLAPAVAFAVALGLIIAVAAQESLSTAIALAVVAGLVGPVLLLLPVLKTMSSVRTALLAITGGDYAARSIGSAPGLLAELVRAVNAMATQVQSEMAVASEGSNRLMSALDSSVDPVLALDSETRVVFANRAALQLFEREAHEIAGNPIAWLLPDEQVIDAVRSARESGTQARIDVERPNRRYFQVVTSAIAGGGEWAVLVVLHDVSDVRRTEQIRRDFVANVSHELRTPLAGIKAVIETLTEGALDDRAAAADFLARADDEVDRLIQLVEELLDLSRIESGEVPLSPRPTDIEGLVRTAVDRLRPQAERKHLSLLLELSGSIGEVMIDPDRIERALVNLVHNAVKFTPEGGTVTVSTGRSDDGVFIRVSDTGIGIDSNAQGRIFERFYKADPSRAGGAGSGIGLAIVKHAVESHGGTVTVESERGLGSTFTIRLPVRRSL